MAAEMKKSLHTVYSFCCALIVMQVATQLSHLTDGGALLNWISWLSEIVEKI